MREYARRGPVLVVHRATMYSVDSISAVHSISNLLMSIMTISAMFDVAKFR